MSPQSSTEDISEDKENESNVSDVNTEVTESAGSAADVTVSSDVIRAVSPRTAREVRSASPRTARQTPQSLRNR